jgi:hypothetical protein
MNLFDRNWQALAAQARQLPPATTDIPPGFAARIVAHWQSSATPSDFSLWLQLSWRTLTGALVLLGLSALLEWHAAKPSNVFFPHTEDTVAQVLWML